MLAAAGLTNKEIGQQLLLSHRTVGAHLYQIFPKLGITTRAALRDALASQPPGRHGKNRSQPLPQEPPGRSRDSKEEMRQRPRGQASSGIGCRLGLLAGVAGCRLAW
jgi:hypothetical protein